MYTFRYQAIILTNDGSLFIRPLGTKFIETWIRIQQLSYEKMNKKLSPAK